MNKIINVGVIGAVLADESFGKSEFENFKVIKVLKDKEALSVETKLMHPAVEIVQDASAILNDQSIELVIFGSGLVPDTELLKKALEAGKQVRII